MLQLSTKRYVYFDEEGSITQIGNSFKEDSNYIKVDYDRVKTTEYYGYILKISYDFKVYSRKKFIGAIIYFILLFSISISSVLALLSWII